jgi:hypothetical protein
MNKRIKTYEDLLEEQQVLISRLKTQEQQIRVDIAGVKEGLKPFGKAMDMVHKMATRDNTAPMLNFGMEMGIDILIRRVLLARAGWFTKIVVPFLVKNYSSHVIGEEKRAALINKIKGFFKKIRPKPTPEAAATRKQPQTDGVGN